MEVGVLSFLVREYLDQSGHDHLFRASCANTIFVHVEFSGQRELRIIIINIFSVAS